MAYLAPISPDVPLSEEIKEVSSIIEPLPVFTEWQIRAILSYAERHAIHIHKVVSFFLSAPVRNRILKYGFSREKEEDSQTVVASASKASTPENTPELVHFLNTKTCLAETAKLLLEE